MNISTIIILNLIGYLACFVTGYFLGKLYTLYKIDKEEQE